MFIKDIRKLISIEFLQIKAYKRYILSSPLVAIKQFLKTLGTIIFFIMYFILLFFNKKSINILKIFSYTIIDYIIMIIFLIIFLSDLLKKNNDYSSFSFNIHDVHYLFPSPIDERSMFVFTLIKSSMYILSYYILIGLVCIFKFKIDISKVILGGLGFILIYIFIKGFKFLIFSLRTRFNCRKEVRIVTFIFLIISIGYGLYSVLFNKQQFKALGFWQLKNFIIYPFKSNIRITEFILMSTLSIVTIYLAVKYAVDYYEEIAEHMGVVEERINEINEKDFDTYIIEESINKKTEIKSYEDNILTRINGSGAFLYKNYIFNQRNDTNKKYIIINIICFIIGVVLTIFNNYFGGHIAKNFIKLLAVIGVFHINILNTCTNDLRYEMDKMYLKLIPSKLYNKVIFISIYNYFLKISFVLSLLIPTIFMNGVNKTILLIGIIDIALISFLYISINNLLTLFVRADIKISESILSMVGYFIVALPIILIIALIIEYNISIVLTAIPLVIINLIVICISIKIFNKIDY